MIFVFFFIAYVSSLFGLSGKNQFVQIDPKKFSIRNISTPIKNIETKFGLVSNGDATGTEYSVFLLAYNYTTEDVDFYQFNEETGENEQVIWLPFLKSDPFGNGSSISCDTSVKYCYVIGKECDPTLHHLYRVSVEDPKEKIKVITTFKYEDIPYSLSSYDEKNGNLFCQFGNGGGKNVILSIDSDTGDITTTNDTYLLDSMGIDTKNNYLWGLGKKTNKNNSVLVGFDLIRKEWKYYTDFSNQYGFSSIKPLSVYDSVNNILFTIASPVNPKDGSIEEDTIVLVSIDVHAQKINKLPPPKCQEEKEDCKFSLFL